MNRRAPQRIRRRLGAISKSMMTAGAVTVAVPAALVTNTENRTAEAGLEGAAVGEVSRPDRFAVNGIVEVTQAGLGGFDVALEKLREEHLKERVRAILAGAVMDESEGVSAAIAAGYTEEEIRRALMMTALVTIEDTDDAPGPIRADSPAAMGKLAFCEPPANYPPPDPAKELPFSGFCVQFERPENWPAEDGQEIVAVSPFLGLGKEPVPGRASRGTLTLTNEDAPSGSRVMYGWQEDLSGTSALLHIYKWGVPNYAQERIAGEAVVDSKPGDPRFEYSVGEDGLRVNFPEQDAQ